jgi:hypothetical protein
MTTIELTCATIQHREPDQPIDDAELAAAAFLARYSGRTLEAYRHDLRDLLPRGLVKRLQDVHGLGRRDR